MKNILPKYVRPLKSNKETSVSVEHWDKATDAFDKGEYKESIKHLLTYINPTVTKEVLSKKGDIDLNLVQGTAHIHLQVVDDTFSIEVPFLKIVEKTNVVALLRRVAEVNFSVLDLARIELDGDALYFRYEAPLSTCQPNKIYNVIRNLCFRADDYDDEFISRYGAVFFKEPKVTYLSDKEKQVVLEQIHEVFAEYETYKKYFREQRKEDYQWDNIILTLLKLSNMPYLQGLLRSEIIENVEAMYNGDVRLDDRINKGSKYVQKLMAYSEEELSKNLYHAEQFMSLLWRSSEHIVEERLEAYNDDITRMEEHENYFALAYYLEGVFLKLIYNFNLDENYKGAIEGVLEKVSGMEVEEGAKELLALYKEMYNVTLNDNISEYVKVKRGAVGTIISVMSNLFYLGLAGYFIYKYFIKGHI